MFGKAGVATFAILCRLSAYYAAPDDAGLDAHISLIRAGKFAEAEALLDEKLKSPSPPARSLYWKGYVQFASKRYKECVPTFQRHLKRFPDDAQAAKVLGLALFMTGDAGGAQQQLERALELNAADGEARYYLGRVHFSRQNMPAALAAFQKLLEIEPRSVRGHNQLGQTYEGLNQFEQAENAYRAAIQIDRQEAKRSEWPYYNLGILQLGAGRAAEALPYLTEALHIQPRFSEARLKRAVALAGTGKMDQAKTELESLVADEPGNADAHYQLGRIFTRLGDAARARQHLLLFQKLRQP